MYQSTSDVVSSLFVNFLISLVLSAVTMLLPEYIFRKSIHKKPLVSGKAHAVNFAFVIVSYVLCYVLTLVITHGEVQIKVGGGLIAYVIGYFILTHDFIKEENHRYSWEDINSCLGEDFKLCHKDKDKNQRLILYVERSYVICMSYCLFNGYSTDNQKETFATLKDNIANKLDSVKNADTETVKSDFIEYVDDAITYMKKFKKETIDKQYAQDKSKANCDRLLEVFVKKVCSLLHIEFNVNSVNEFKHCLDSYKESVTNAEKE